MPDATNAPIDDAFAGAEEAAAREAAEVVRGETDGPKRKVTKAHARTAGRRSAAVAGPPAQVIDAAGSAEEAEEPAPAPTNDHEPRAVRGDEIITTDTITITQGGIQSASARLVNIRQGGIGRLRADDVTVTQGGIGAARADRISVELGGVGAALTGELHVTQGAVNSVIARDVAVEQSFIRSVVANRVTFGRATGAFIVVARRVDGEVRTLLDWRGAAVFGAVFGLVTGLLRRRR